MTESQEYIEFKFTREEFYELIWSKPATQIAADVGCSDVLIAKICKSYRIPKPPVGYWAKLQHGKKAKRIALPTCNDPDVQSLIFRKHPQKDKSVKVEPDPDYDPDVIQILQRAQKLPPLQVPSRVSRFHPLVQLTKKALESCRHEERGLLHGYRYDNQNVLNVTVSRKSLQRSMCIMHAITKRIEDIGGKVVIQEDRWRKSTTDVIIAGEQVGSLKLRERYTQHRVEKPKDIWSSRMSYEPNGMLVLESDSYFSSIYCQDTAKKYRLEDRLSKIFIDFVKKAGDIRIGQRRAETARLQQETEEKERMIREAELQRRREELQQKQQQEQNRINELMRNVKGWRQSQDVRNYLDTYKKYILQKEGVLPDTGPIADYFKWVEHQADRYDPYKPSPHSVLDETICE